MTIRTTFEQLQAAIDSIDGDHRATTKIIGELARISVNRAENKPTIRAWYVENDASHDAAWDNVFAPLGWTEKEYFRELSCRLTGGQALR